MLYHASMPKRFWGEAFGTTVWLINRQASQNLSWESPFFKLFNREPYYSSLRVFGCRCFPFLRDYAKSKLDPWSLPWIQERSFLDIAILIKGISAYIP